MTLKQKKTNLKFIIKELSELYPFAKIQLDFNSPYELLVSTILSAQCTDARVNQVTALMFPKYNKPEEFAYLELSVIEEMIFSTGFYKAKAKNIQLMSKVLLEKFSGNVPSTMEELLSLPGVGRKTANVILGHIWDIPSIVVDTHVIRIANRLGLVSTENAEKIEFELMKLIDKEEWVVFTHYMINFGRNVCLARKPKCNQCPLSEICPTFKTF